MPAFGPIKRSELISALRRFGFAGPYSGGKHQLMVKGDLKLFIPNPHESDIGRDLLGVFCARPALTGANGKKFNSRDPGGAKNLKVLGRGITLQWYS
jgi:hypothetical protein